MRGVVVWWCQRASALAAFLHLCAVCTIDPEIGHVTCRRHTYPSPRPHLKTRTCRQTLPQEYHSPLDAVKSMATVKLICVLEKGRRGGGGHGKKISCRAAATTTAAAAEAAECQQSMNSFLQTCFFSKLHEKTKQKDNYNNNEIMQLEKKRK